MGLEVLKAEFAVVWAKICENDLLNPFLNHLEEDYNLYDFEHASEIVKQEGRFRL